MTQGMCAHVRRTMLTLAGSAVILASSCATLGQLSMLVQPPRFERAADQQAEVRFIAPTARTPLGGAAIRLWTKVSNPNAFGFTLATLRGTVFLDDARATAVDLPLGLPLEARGAAVIPIDLELSFAELPALREVIQRAIRRDSVAYRLDGTVGVETARFGRPEFGPMTILVDLLKTLVALGSEGSGVPGFRGFRRATNRCTPARPDAEKLRRFFLALDSGRKALTLTVWHAK